MKHLFAMHKKQTGGTIVGFIVGVVLGLGVALLVAIYVTKVPVPFLNKSATFTNKQESDEAQKNKNWDPNTPLYDKNAARRAGAAPAPGVPGAPAAPLVAPAVAGGPAVPAATGAGVAAVAVPSDPLGDLAKSRSAAVPATNASAAPAGAIDPFDYFVQAGAFRSQVDADAQRAKLAMLGWEARVNEREQSGRTVYRVRIGPFVKRVDADQLKEKLDGAGVETALVRVQR